MASESTAFCPGHITAFFEIHENTDILRKGSRGAGLCLSKGVVSTVSVSESTHQDISIHIDGRRAMDTVTELAVRKWLGSQQLRIAVDSVNQLPVSQGFGISGAGALSALVALADVTGSNQPMENLVQTAHIAEVESLTGLGDVYPQSKGGMVIRELPGAPPYGRLRKIEIDHEVDLCVLGEEIDTKEVLQNKKTVKKINRFGKAQVDSFIANPDLERLFLLSEEFATETGLASDRIKEAIESCTEFGYAGMSMLGNSVFACGETKHLVNNLKRFGKVVRCDVDNRGARAI